MRKVPRSEDIVTLNEAAQRLGVGPPFLLKVIAEGGFPARRVGRRYFINWEAVLEWSRGVDTGKATPKRTRAVPARTSKTAARTRTPDTDIDAASVSEPADGTTDAPNPAAAPSDPGDGG